MVDDSELQARIAARVAARRAGSLQPLRSGTPSPEPIPQPTPEPIPHPTPEPIPHPTPDPEPGNGRPRPDTGNEQPRARRTRRPRPGPRRPAGDVVQPEALSEPAGSEPEQPKDAGEKQKDSQPRGGAVLRRMVRIAVLLAIAAAAAIVLRIFVVAPYYIPSGSMEPTLHGCAHCDDDHILIDKVSYHFHGPQEGDIVVFNRPPRAQTQDKVLVKRVIGLPGDHVALRHGLVYINNKRLAEPYLDKKCGPRPSRPDTGRSRWTIPRDDVFVMGDNRCDSLDSRDFGPIRESSIIGRAFAIVWPLGRIRLL